MGYFTANLTDEEEEVRAELKRQDAKFGEQNHEDGTSIAWREDAEGARDRCQELAAAGVVTWTDILLEEVFEAFAETDPERLIEELLQVEAVARQWRMAIRRRQAAATGSQDAEVSR